MENKLENLKEKMDGTILRDVYFDDKQYHRVLNSINNSQFQKQPSTLRNKFNFLLSISVVSIMFLSITYFVGTQLQFFDGIQVKRASDSEGTIPNTPIKDTNSEAKYIPPKQEENYKEMTKEEILTKMINTVDNFETAIGEYKIHYNNIPGDSDSVVEYSISLKNKPGGFGKRTDIVNGKEEVNLQYYTDGSVWILSQQTKTFLESKYLEEAIPGTPLKINDAFSIDSDGNNSTIYRERPPIDVANETLFPYEIVSNYTRDLNSWNIEKQNEKLLGHNTLVIKGNINRRDFQSFRFWVDKDTGILLKYETYNSTGDVVEYLYPKRLEINVPIDNKKFTPNLDGYQNFDLSR